MIFSTIQCIVKTLLSTRNIKPTTKYWCNLPQYTTFCCCEKLEDIKGCNQKPQIEDEQTIQWSSEKAQKDKQRSTKYYTENQRSSNTNPTKTGGEVRCPGSVASSSSTCSPRRVVNFTNPVISHE